MAKFAALFSFKPEVTARMIEKPSDRAAAARDLAKSIGGDLLAYYWMLGKYDGIAIFELPDSKSMMAVSAAVTSTGTFSRFETHEVVAAEDIAGILEKAKQVRYRPPGT